MGRKRLILVNNKSSSVIGVIHTNHKKPVSIQVVLYLITLIQKSKSIIYPNLLSNLMHHKTTTIIPRVDHKSRKKLWESKMKNGKSQGCNHNSKLYRMQLILTKILSMLIGISNRRILSLRTQKSIMDTMLKFQGEMKT